MEFFISKSSGRQENGASIASSLLLLSGARFKEGAKELLVFVLESAVDVSAAVGGIEEG